MLKMYNSSYKYNNVDIMASVILTYFWLKFIDMLLFTMCAGTCICTYIHMILKFLLQMAQVPVLRIDVCCVGRCCVQHLPNLC
jgi:hypothetical protein